METAYRITTARPEHIHRLAAIERAAATICPAADLPAELRDEVVPVTLHDEAQQAGRLWVVEAIEEGPVGYALVQFVDGLPHLAQMDVHPKHARQGLGTRLVETIKQWAIRHNHAAITLTTFVHLPWNGPYYQRLGFRVLPGQELTVGLREVLAAEAEKGLDPNTRVAMRMDLRASCAISGA